MFFLLACSDYDLQAKKEEQPPVEDTATDTAPIVEDTDTTTPTETAEITTTPDPDKPVALCDVSPNPVQPPFEEATWDGSGSNDPMGASIVSYTWTLVSAPTGSVIPMPSGSGPRRSGFIPDLAGDYVGQLVVTTDDGRVSDPCETTLQAVPGEAIWVELFWDHASDDLDLHMTRPGGSLETNGDCYYANCVPVWMFMLEWGDSADTTDNPRLDLDDIPGTGPENINLDSPWSGYSGVYTVTVHDYALSGQTYGGVNNATVNIYLSGLLVFSETREISGEDTYTDFAAIDAAAATVTPL